MKINRPIVFAVLVAALVTAGCARTDDPSPAGAPSLSSAPLSAQPSSPAPSIAPPPATDLPTPTKGGPTAAGAQTITGMVSAGVEPGCVLLTGSSGSHLLIFADASLKAKAEDGARVVVSGKAEPDMMTTCQQGIPFVVTAIRPAAR